MKFHKSVFVIQMNPGYGTVECVCGWVDESNTYGFYKSFRNMWRAVDLMSGTLITVQPTRKVCAEWIEENIERISEVKERQAYRIKVDDFYNMIKKELEGF